MSTDFDNNSRISPYFEGFRQDIIDIVPATAKCVLSVGCATGRAEAELVKRGIKVVGIEINSEAAEIARLRKLIIFEGDASQIDVGIGGELYDCLIYADVLEHLPEPISVLKRHVKSLKANGIVYICVPNFRHFSIFWQLFIRGHVNYTDAGILDRTHLRITTRKMVMKWFEQAGIEFVNCKYFIHGRRDKLVSACLFGLAKEFIASQVGLVGKKIKD